MYHMKNKIVRMWVNQPSTLQPLHHMHGTNVLATRDSDGGARVYFLSGPIVSQQMMWEWLSLGWRA